MFSVETDSAGKYRLYQIQRDDTGEDWRTCLGVFYTYTDAMEALEYQETKETEWLQNIISIVEAVKLNDAKRKGDK